MDDPLGEGVEPFGYQGHYVSCMKINGVPLLPPLMTEEYRHEMQYYKRLAVAVERRISELKVCLDDSTIDDTHNHPSDTEECFDGANISFDINPERSSLSERHNLNYDHSTTVGGDISECSKIDDVFDNNEFESMNSQVTIIDFSSEHNNYKIPAGGKSEHKDDDSERQLFLKEDVTLLSYERKMSTESAGTGKVSDSELYVSDNPVLKYENCTKNVQQESIVLASTDSENEGFKLGKKKSREIDDNLKHVTKNNVSSKENKKPMYNNIISKTNSKMSLKTNSSPKTKKISLLKNENKSPYQSFCNTKKAAPKKGISLNDFSKSQKKILTVESHKLSPSKNVTGSLNNISSGLTSPPKLVRQNSYTLESPSPLLLAHLEVQSMTSGVDVGSISMSESTSTSQLHSITNKKGWDIDTAKKTWKSMKSDVSSISSNIKNCTQSETKSSKSNKSLSEASTKRMTDNSTIIQTTPSRNSTDSKNAHSSSSKKSSVHNASERKEIHNQAIKDTQLLQATVLQNSQSNVQNAFVNKFVDLNKSVEALYNDPNSKPIKESPNIYLNYIMKKFNEDHEKQMLDLVKKQQEEQVLLQKAFENQQQLLMAQFETAFVHAKDSSGHMRNQDKDFDKVQSSPLIKEIRENKPEKLKLLSDREQSKHQQDMSYIEGNTEKYLTISADVLSKSRCLLINRKTVNLSPTDIQCVNVMPVQSSMSCLLSDIDIYNGDRHSVSSSNGAHHSKKTNERSDISENERNNVNAVRSWEFNKPYMDNETENLIDEPLETGRSGNTMDDLNFTFTSEDLSHTNQLYLDDPKHNNSSSFRHAEHGKDQEKTTKLKNALSKISEIQKSLASQSYGQQRRNSRLSHDYPMSDRYMSESEQNISLSSIEAMPNYYSDSQIQRNYVDRNSLSLNLTEINKPSSNRPLQKKTFKTSQEIEREFAAASKIVAHCKGYLTRRLMKTERVEGTVQTIRDTLLCALQLHHEGGIQGPDVDLHRRLIQQITAACYALHDTFITCSPAERMSIIAQDRERRLMLIHRNNIGMSSLRQLSATTQRTLKRKLDGMSRSHSGVFTNRSTRSMNYPSNVMTRSHYEQSDHLRHGLMDKASRSVSVSGDSHSRKPWR